ncbi:hypothetical protein CGMCC3_g3198 [Colletotrichum fructicola]|nr:uncharacterized protein CGMCC3_g3198 [Colletotrichum fructicola]KAE9581110.1 hypothetical protein CGMCC3_g3198 [Colletotrichum fructicola]
MVVCDQRHRHPAQIKLNLLYGVQQVSTEYLKKSD